MDTTVPLTKKNYYNIPHTKQKMTKEGSVSVDLMTLYCKILIFRYFFLCVYMVDVERTATKNNAETTKKKDKKIDSEELRDSDHGYYRRVLEIITDERVGWLIGSRNGLS